MSVKAQPTEHDALSIDDAELHVEKDTELQADLKTKVQCQFCQQIDSLLDLKQPRTCYRTHHPECKRQPPTAFLDDALPEKPKPDLL